MDWPEVSEWAACLEGGLRVSWRPARMAVATSTTVESAAVSAQLLPTAPHPLKKGAEFLPSCQ